MRTREFSWLGVFVIGLMMGLYKSMISSWADGVWFFMFSLVGLILFLFRRQQRQDDEMRDYFNQPPPDSNGQ